MPVGRAGTTYSPALFVLVVRLIPRPTLLIVTMALGITAPVLSSTVPVIRPVSWADAAAERSSRESAMISHLIQHGSGVWPLAVRRGTRQVRPTQSRIVLLDSSD